MRTVEKDAPPDCVRNYLRSTPTASFKDLVANCGEAMIGAFLGEQKGLCAFRCNRLDDMPEPKRGRIAHVSPRALKWVSETEWRNLVLSCDGGPPESVSCDVAQRNEELPVSPLTPGIETLFDYYPSGRMVGKTKGARDAVRILNLDSPEEDDRDHRLRRARRDAIVAAAALKAKKTPAEWARLLTGDYRPLPAFQPALAAVLGH